MSILFFLINLFCTIFLLSLLGSTQGTHQAISLIFILQSLATAAAPALTLNNVLSLLFHFSINLKPMSYIFFSKSIINQNRSLISIIIYI